MVVVFVQVLLKSRSDFNVVVFCNRLYPRENALLFRLAIFTTRTHVCGWEFVKSGRYAGWWFNNKAEKHDFRWRRAVNNKYYRDNWDKS